MGTVKKQRCSWCGSDPLYVQYHDEEWGVPVTDEQAVFERLMLEGMQAGLSWLTVLRKRQRMQERFFEFDIERLARSSSRNLESWLQDAGLIRHRGKLEALIHNAKITRSLDNGLAETLWAFVDFAQQVNQPKAPGDVPSKTDVAEAMSKALKGLGYKFVGPTICYAFMQSAGLVNDHFVSCHRHQPCARLGQGLSSQRFPPSQS